MAFCWAPGGVSASDLVGGRLRTRGSPRSDRVGAGDAQRQADGLRIHSLRAERGAGIGRAIGKDGRFTLTCFGKDDGAVIGKHSLEIFAVERISSTKERHYVPEKILQLRNLRSGEGNHRPDGRADRRANMGRRQAVHQGSWRRRIVACDRKQWQRRAGQQQDDNQCHRAVQKQPVAGGIRQPGFGCPDLR